MTPPMRHFERLLAVDWGTSSLRGALVSPQGRTLEERFFERGILSVEAGHFPAVFKDCFGDWTGEHTLGLMSGMVGGRQGWQETDYCPCPAGFADLVAHLHWLTPSLAIVPGLCQAGAGDEPADVMRGEETQIFGALALLGLDSARVVHPGTHSKWVQVAQQRVTHFSTWMTGEFYALLRHHSLLARTLPALEPPADATAFEAGLRRASQGPGLLHHAFGVRTLALFKGMAAEALPSYLSGLLVGEELRAQVLRAGEEVVLIGAGHLTARYSQALALRGVSCRTVGDAATWAGLHAVARALGAFDLS
jgi:2-dehydro-3-deoxygalactonokinase